MSYTEIYKVTPKGNTKFRAEIRNAHRGAMAVWDYLDKKYLPPFIKYGRPFSRMLGEEMQEVWDLQKDSRLLDCERIALLSTFDNCMCLKDDVYKLTKAFREFPGNSSLPEQADEIEKIATEKLCIGIVWNQTSVNADIPEKNVTGKVWSLFEAFDDIKATITKTP